MPPRKQSCRHDRTDARMNSRRLWQHLQDLHRFNLEKSQHREGEVAGSRLQPRSYLQSIPAGKDNSGVSATVCSRPQAAGFGIAGQHKADSVVCVCVCVGGCFVSFWYFLVLLIFYLFWFSFFIFVSISGEKNRKNTKCLVVAKWGGSGRNLRKQKTGSKYVIWTKKKYSWINAWVDEEKLL